MKKKTLFVRLLGLAMLISLAPALRSNSEKNFKDIAQVYDLNGTWELEPGQRLPRKFTRRVPVPGLIDLAEPPVPFDARRKTPEEIAWNAVVGKAKTERPRRSPGKWYFYYRTRFVAPEKKYENVHLTIGAAKYGVKVWVNGKEAGAYWSAFVPRELDISSLVFFGRANELIIRVGEYRDIDKEQWVGSGDPSKRSFIPGIWGDVSIKFCGNPRIRAVQVIPHIEKRFAEARVWIENKVDMEVNTSVMAVVQPRSPQSSPQVGAAERPVKIPPHDEVMVSLKIKIDDLQLWSPDHPFLYELITRLKVENNFTDERVDTFGMRSFEIRKGDFFLNGKRIFLRGSNIAFHRWLSDPERGRLAWDQDFIRKVLIEIPKQHNFNSFRNHIGHMYSGWYDAADEHGMLIQDEWFMWLNPLGQLNRELCLEEFRRWLESNWNHPSIVIWDLCNECNAEPERFMIEEIAPVIKEWDPTRPVEPEDFKEYHTYHYGLAPVIPTHQVSPQLPSWEHLQSRERPIVSNEFPWFWTDSLGRPETGLHTSPTLTRYWGKRLDEVTGEEAMAIQSELTGFLVELYRRIEMDGIQSFVYLSDSHYTTRNYFFGPLTDFRLKPVMGALKNAFAPFAASLELLDRNFYTSEERTFELFVHNDDPDETARGVVKIWIELKTEAGRAKAVEFNVEVPPVSTIRVPVTLRFPESPGGYLIRSAMLQGSEVVNESGREARVFAPVSAPVSLIDKKIAVWDPEREIVRFLAKRGLEVYDLTIMDKIPLDAAAAVVAQGWENCPDFKAWKGRLGAFAFSGGTVIFMAPSNNETLEPEPGKWITLVPGLSLLRINPHFNSGYESAVFPNRKEREDYPALWDGLTESDLVIMNGDLGGRMVSESWYLAKTFPARGTPARSGIFMLKTTLYDFSWGAGSVVFSRVRIKGRLDRESPPPPPPYPIGSSPLREDPVAQRWMINLLVQFAD